MVEKRTLLHTLDATSKLQLLFILIKYLPEVPGNHLATMHCLSTINFAPPTHTGGKTHNTLIKHSTSFQQQPQGEKGEQGSPGEPGPKVSMHVLFTNEWICLCSVEDMTKSAQV